MKTTIEVKEVEDKTSQFGKKYLRALTSVGWVSVFDVKEIAAMRAMVGKSVDVELIDTGEFKNIRKVYTDATADGEQAVVQEIVPKLTNEQKFAEAKENKTHCVRASYIKDWYSILSGEQIVLEKEVENQELFARAVLLEKQAWDSVK